MTRYKNWIARKYDWPILYCNIEIYVKECNVYLAFKAICHKPYGDLQLLLVPIYCWKDLLIDFVTSLPLSANWKSNSYNSILIIVNHLTKIVHYKLVKVTINTLELAEVIINMVVQYHGLSDSIISDCRTIFLSKFWSLLCYFLGIKKQLFTRFYP